MYEVMAVFRREFLERVRSKAFVIGTVLFPIFMAAMWIIPAKMGGGGGTRHLVLVDQAPAGVGQAVVQLLTAPAPAGTDDDERFIFTVDRVAHRAGGRPARADGRAGAAGRTGGALRARAEEPPRDLHRPGRRRRGPQPTPRGGSCMR